MAQLMAVTMQPSEVDVSDVGNNEQNKQPMETIAGGAVGSNEVNTEIVRLSQRRSSQNGQHMIWVRLFETPNSWRYLREIQAHHCPNRNLDLKEVRSKLGIAGNCHVSRSEL